MTQKVAGWGWRHDDYFICGSYDLKNIDNSNIEDAVEKLALNAAKLSYPKYVRKERNGEIIQNEMPDSFAITPYHIIFMTTKNITVLSKP